MVTILNFLFVATLKTKNLPTWKRYLLNMIIQEDLCNFYYQVSTNGQCPVNIYLTVLKLYMKIYSSLSVWRTLE